MTRPSKQNESPAPGLAPGLYLVATPIGHAEDITLRALRVIRDADTLLAEDTRVTRKLLSLHGLDRRLEAYHDHSGPEMRADIVARLAAGEAVALVSDAGTPLVSDPGYKLVRAAIDAGHKVTAVPGASSLLAALTLSGLPPDRFFFAGFLPPKAGARARAIADMADIPGTLVLLEGASRVPATLAALAEGLGARPAALARELTKRFEEVARAPLPELAARYAAEGPPKGEVVILVGPPEAGAREADAAAALDGALREALARSSLREAVAEVTRALRLPRKQVYARALDLKGGDA